MGIARLTHAKACPVFRAGRDKERPRCSSASRWSSMAEALFTAFANSVERGFAKDNAYQLV